MSTSTFLTAILINCVLSDKDVCGYDCSYKTTDKPCRSVDKLDTTCIDYNYYGVCPDDYEDCTQCNKDICSKECSYKTIGKPCMHINKDDNTCFDYLGYGECPPGTKDCSDAPKLCQQCNKDKPCLHNNKGEYNCLPKNGYGQCNPGGTLCVYKEQEIKYERNCDLCSKSKPCLSDNYIYGEYKCFEQEYDYSKYICPDGSSLCEKYDTNICDKKCSDKTRGKPCIHINKDDNTCFDYMKHGGCPPGTKDCSANVEHPCEYCNAYKPCLHNNNGDYSCLGTNKYGECSPGSTLCVYNDEPKKYKRKCEICSKSKPCLGDEYIKGIYNCYEQEYRNGKYICPDETNICETYETKYKRNCDTCTKDKPCLHDDYIYGDYKCYQQIYKNDKYICPDRTSICEYYEPNTCNKECSYMTKGKPCIHLNKGDNTCFDYMEYGGCPPGTRDCGNKVKNPCEYCNEDKPCLHDNYGDYSCLSTNKYGECNPGSTLCIYRDDQEEPKYKEKETYNTQNSCKYCQSWLACWDGNKHKCVEYIDWHHKICPKGTENCYGKEQNDNCDYCPSWKRCYDYDKAKCIGYIDWNYKICPKGSKNCGELKNPSYVDYNPKKTSVTTYKPKQPKYKRKCEICSKSKPCVSDNYIYGEYECYEQEYKYGNYVCPPGSSICELYDSSICDKKCSYMTKSKPCMHLNKGDNTCFDYMEYGGCPPGTKDCSNNVNNPCQYCNKDKPCLHDNYGDFSCLETNKYGKCNPGSSLCVYPNNNYYGGLTEISKEVEDIINKEKISEKELMSITLISSTLVYLIGLVCFVSILYLIWKYGCFNKSNNIKFEAVNDDDLENVALNK